MEKQAAIPKTHLIPTPEWQSNENLDLRGDVLDAIQQSLYLANDAINKLNQALNVVLGQNLKSGKAKISYVWNNGDEPTPEEIAEHESKLKELQDLKKQKMEEFQKNQNAEKTGLVGPDGQPIGTTQPLNAPDFKEEDTIPHILTQEDIDNNPELSQVGLTVGDEVRVPKKPTEEELQLEASTEAGEIKDAA